MEDPRFDINFNGYRELSDYYEGDEDDDSDLMPPLFWYACGEQDVEFMKFLLDNNIDLATQNYDISPLVKVCVEFKHGNDKSKEILDLLCDISDIQAIGINQIARGVLANKSPKIVGFEICNNLAISPYDLLGNQPDIDTTGDILWRPDLDVKQVIQEIEEKIRSERAKSARPENSTTKKQKL